MILRSPIIFSSIVITALVLSCGREPSMAEGTTESTGSSTASDTVTQNQSAAATPDASAYDLQFIDAMVRHHESAVQMAKLAASKAAAPELKQMAAKMTTDQEKEIAQLKAWRAQWFANAPLADSSAIPGASSMNMDMSHMDALKGHQFDMMFIDMMIPHHEAAITMSCDAHARAQKPELKTFARDVIRAQEMEISQLQKWKSTMKM